ncbi:YugN family protein [Aureibacillus halotolerans]|uniref:YugN-like protein n=1 Tax=Aureibacillus halotolerans TaxID=1508390 RepID=A0A4R6U3Y4_9BACI|nr:YugN family protein [Aureibacillus halotolerans]TDQ40396.1 YugN-like protein [Aureibacillus halotolerans]
MEQLSSALDGLQMKLSQLAERLEASGFTLGSNWEYDHGYYDYNLPADGTYYFLRIPVKTTGIGEIDDPDALVSVGTPLVLGHQYQRSLDDHANIGNLSASFNQFQEPEDKDTTIPDDIIEAAKQKLAEAEVLFVRS